MHLLFDYDGTLHETMRIYGPAFRMACGDLAARGLIEPRHDSDAEIAAWLGFSTLEMWRRFLPELPQPEKERSSRMIGGEMLRLVRAGQAALYPQAEETLAALKARGHTLILLSNCRQAYLEAHVQAFGLARFFSACYCCEEFGDIPKYDIFPVIYERWPGDYVVIGDRFFDLEVALRHDLPSVGCLYGYGSAEELSAATYRIPSLPELLKLPFV